LVRGARVVRMIRIAAMGAAALLALAMVFAAGVLTPKLLALSRTHDALIDYRAEVISQIEAGNIEYVRHIHWLFIEKTDIGQAYVLTDLGALDPALIWARMTRDEPVMGDISRAPVTGDTRFFKLLEIWYPVAEAAWASDHPLIKAHAIRYVTREQQMALYHHYHDVLDEALQAEDFELAYYTFHALQIIRGDMVFDSNAYDEPRIAWDVVANDLFETTEEWLFRLTLLAHLSGADHFSYRAGHGERASRWNAGEYAAIYLDPTAYWRRSGHSPERDRQVQSILQAWEAENAY
jgi:hypothetical protein